jgi:hypothetical protein
MMEDEFVDIALAAAQEVLGPPLSIRRGAALLYEVTVDNRLQLTIDPRAPRRGQSAFQTDLAVFETVGDGVDIPRVVLEFKQLLSTHDVLTYSAKARKHKQVYPYLRYGLVVSSDAALPGRFFRHNEALDFGVAAAAYGQSRLHQLFEGLLKVEVEASRTLERIFYGGLRTAVFRFGVEVDTNAGMVV